MNNNKPLNKISMKKIIILSLIALIALMTPAMAFAVDQKPKQQKANKSVRVDEPKEKKGGSKKEKEVKEKKKGENKKEMKEEDKKEKKGKKTKAEEPSK